MKVALFDFCETLVSFQSADPYLRYVLEKAKIRVPNKRLNINFINRVYFHLFNISICKNTLLRLTKGVPFSRMNEYAGQYYEERIKPGLIKDSIALLRKLQQEGYKIYIVSAGFDIYIKYFAQDFNVDKIICSRIKFDNGISSGKLDGVDLIGSRKTEVLTKKFNLKSLKAEDSVAVSDSRSDLPLLNYCKRKIVVCQKRPAWSTNEMEVLLWN